MQQQLKELVEKHVFMYRPDKVNGHENRHGCTTYLTKGVCVLASELGVSYDTAEEIVKDYISFEL